MSPNHNVSNQNADQPFELKRGRNNNPDILASLKQRAGQVAWASYNAKQGLLTSFPHLSEVLAQPAVEQTPVASTVVESAPTPDLPKETLLDEPQAIELDAYRDNLTKIYEDMSRAA